MKFWYRKSKRFQLTDKSRVQHEFRSQNVEENPSHILDTTREKHIKRKMIQILFHYYMNYISLNIDDHLTSCCDNQKGET